MHHITPLIENVGVPSIVWDSLPVRLPVLHDREHVVEQPLPDNHIGHLLCLPLAYLPLVYCKELRTPVPPDTNILFIILGKILTMLLNFAYQKIFVGREESGILHRSPLDPYPL